MSVLPERTTDATQVTLPQRRCSSDRTAFNGLNDDGRLALFCSREDRSHFSPSGALLLARMIADALAQEPTVKGLLRPSAEWPTAVTAERK